MNESELLKLKEQLEAARSRAEAATAHFDACARDGSSTRAYDIAARAYTVALAKLKAARKTYEDVEATCNADGKKPI